MLKIDSHQHFWKYDPIKLGWINETMAVLKSDFLPSQLFELLREEEMDGCIAVQADESEEENQFLLQLALDNTFIKGVVGWIDFYDPSLADKLDLYSQTGMMKGFRHILQDKSPRDLMLSDTFQKGFSLMGRHSFCYDLLIRSDQLPFAAELVAKFPGQLFVLDHLAKPMIAAGEIAEWKKYLQALSKHDNVYCKLSGLITEADWHQWKYEDFEPYLNVAFESFGADRLLFGSDWPVCNLAGGYRDAIEILRKYTSSLTSTEKEKFWGANAVKCYHLS